MTPKKRRPSGSKQCDGTTSPVVDKQSSAISICKRVPDPSAGVSGLSISQSNKQGQSKVPESSNKSGMQSKQTVTDQQKAAAIGQKGRLNSGGRRQYQKANSSPRSNPISPEAPSQNHLCSTLDEFARRAVELKDDIKAALEKQATIQEVDESPEVSKLKEEILRVSGLSASNEIGATLEAKSGNGSYQSTKEPDSIGEQISKVSKVSTETETLATKGFASEPESDINDIQATDKDTVELVKVDPTLNSAIHEDNSGVKIKKLVTVKESTKNSDNCAIQLDSFATLDAKLDEDSKYIALISSLRKHFTESPPQILESICRKMVQMSEQNSQLSISCENYDSENQKLTIVKQKLENLCRELQKSNNSIRIESLDLIKLEQGKAKEQTAKIQSTLSGVIKLFDENQQRNMSLRQENHELQQKLKALLDHCDNWEKSVDVALKHKELENRLLKTELAKANLLKNEEKEKFLGEKQELLRILSMMQEQQHRIEAQEAKLRSDLSNYASKYDECQAVISKGVSKFQTESKRMLQQIQKSKQDYKQLLMKYETCTRTIQQLLEEKRHWDKTLGTANKKIETLEKLCRALRERKQGSSVAMDNDRDFKNELVYIRSPTQLAVKAVINTKSKNLAAKGLSNVSRTTRGDINLLDNSPLLGISCHGEHAIDKQDGMKVQELISDESQESLVAPSDCQLLARQTNSSPENRTTQSVGGKKLICEVINKSGHICTRENAEIDSENGQIAHQATSICNLESKQQSTRQELMTKQLTTDGVFQTSIATAAPLQTAASQGTCDGSDSNVK